MKKVIFTILVAKICIFLLIIFSYFLLPFSRSSYLSNFHLGNTINLSTAFSTWDAQHYLSLAQSGYKSNSQSDRFFPVFPFTIHLLSPILGLVGSGLFIANLASFVGFIYFYLFAKEFLKSQEKAYVSLVTFLIFPTSFFFSIIYSESVFLCFMMIAFYYLYKRKIYITALTSIFLPLIRPTGIFVIVPFILYIIFDYKNEIFAFSKVHILQTHIPFRRSLLIFFSTILGFIFYMLIMGKMIGNPFAGFAFQNDIAGHLSSISIFNWNFIKDIIPQHLVLHDPNNSLIDRLFFIIFLLSLPVIWRKTDRILFALSLVMGLVPLLGSFMSYTRYVLMIFPFFIALGSLFGEKENKEFNFFYTYSALLLQGLFIILQSLNYWVA